MTLTTKEILLYQLLAWLNQIHPVSPEKKYYSVWAVYCNHLEVLLYLGISRRLLRHIIHDSVLFSRPAGSHITSTLLYLNPDYSYLLKDRVDFITMATDRLYFADSYKHYNQKIYEFLQENTNVTTTKQITDALGIHRKAVNEGCNVLKAIGMLKMEERDGKTYFVANPYNETNYKTAISDFKNFKLTITRRIQATLQIQKLKLEKKNLLASITVDTDKETLEEIKIKVGNKKAEIRNVTDNKSCLDCSLIYFSKTKYQVQKFFSRVKSIFTWKKRCETEKSLNRAMSDTLRDIKGYIFERFYYNVDNLSDLNFVIDKYLSDTPEANQELKHIGILY